MSRFVVLSFVFMGWAFYELSGGADFEPRKAELIAEARAAEAAAAEERAARVAARNAAAAITVAPVTQVSLAKADVQPVQTQAERVETDAPAPAVLHSEPRPQATLISLEQSSTLFARPLTQLQEIVADAAEATPAAAGVDIREVTGSRVNMRNGPGTSFGVLTSLTRGTAVEVIGGDGAGWVKLRTIDDQMVGWMAEYLLSDPTG